MDRWTRGWECLVPLSIPHTLVKPRINLERPGHQPASADSLRLGLEQGLPHSPLGPVAIQKRLQRFQPTTSLLSFNKITWRVSRSRGMFRRLGHSLVHASSLFSHSRRNQSTTGCPSESFPARPMRIREHE